MLAATANADYLAEQARYQQKRQTLPITLQTHADVFAIPTAEKTRTAVPIAE